MQDTIVAGAKDFSSVLTKVKTFNPEVLFFVATTAPDNAIGVRQVKELGIKATFFGTEGARDKKDFIQAAEGAAEGAYVYHFAPMFSLFQRRPTTSKNSKPNMAQSAVSVHLPMKP